MAKYKTYALRYIDSDFESDSMKNCVEQYYREHIRGFDMNKFDERYERDKYAWTKFFETGPGRIVEIEVEGG